MTYHELETDWLSLRRWVVRTVLPSACVLVVLLATLHALISVPQYKNQAAAIMGFFSLYFILVRGGHLIMIRSLHFDLKRTYGPAYEKLLGKIGPQKRPYNLGFLLARIKRRLINDREAKRR